MQATTRSRNCTCLAAAGSISRTFCVVASSYLLPTASTTSAAALLRGKMLLLSAGVLPQMLVLVAALVSSATASTGLRAAWYSNAVLAPSAPGPTGLNCSGSVPSLSLNFSSSTAIACAGSKQQRPTLELFSARFDAMLTAPSAGSYEFRVVTNGGVRFWIDECVHLSRLPGRPLFPFSCAELLSSRCRADTYVAARSHILVDSSCDPPQPPSAGLLQSADHPRPKDPVCREWGIPANHTAVTFAGRDNVTHHIEKGLHLRLEWLHTGGGPAHLELLWRPGTPSAADGLTANESPFVPVPPSALTPSIKPAEEWRQDLQRGLSKGWNTWMRDNAMRHLHLPSGFGVEIQLWNVPDAAPPAPPSAAPHPGPVQQHVDWRDHLPGVPMIKADNISGCVERCIALPHCVATSWNGPTSDHFCNFKCSIKSPYHTPPHAGAEAVVVRPGKDTCGD
eukprot:COSAG06_NODE_9457_length_1896_cov_1.814691_2_plen_450_part_01